MQKGWKDYKFVNGRWIGENKAATSGICSIINVILIYHRLEHFLLIRLSQFAHGAESKIEKVIDLN